MIYEMRSYRAMPGRLPDLLKRFDTITLKLFEKHGIKQAGFWVTEVGESNHNLIYLAAYESMADREQKWGGVLQRSRMACEARRDREERPAGDDVLEPVPQADELLVGEMTRHASCRSCPRKRASSSSPSSGSPLSRGRADGGYATSLGPIQRPIDAAFERGEQLHHLRIDEG